MSLFAIIGLILLMLGILVVAGAVPGGVMLGVVAALVGVGFLLAGTGRLRR